MRYDALLFEEECDVIGREDVLDGEDLGVFDLTEHGDFRYRAFLEGFWTTAGNLDM